MTASEIIELRLDAFKSFRNERLPLAGATLLTGRNSTGKSNALDGLEVLARLAGGEDIRDALDGRQREGGAIRGGSEGCAPHGTDTFSLGCTVKVDQAIYRYDLSIRIGAELRIVKEQLSGPGTAARSSRTANTQLIMTREPEQSGTGLQVEVHNGKQGRNNVHAFRDNRLVLSQIALPEKNEAERSVMRGVTAVLSALRGVFHLDPVPHLMRDFVPGRDKDLRRTGENVSAALLELERSDPNKFDELQNLVREIADDRVEGIRFVGSELGDVMMALVEQRGPTQTPELTPARQMSDGLLRFTAVATALLSAQHGLDVDRTVSPRSSADPKDLPEGGVLIVLEELENGLHPSQARRVLDLVRHSTETPGTSALVTTHSPALLDAAEGSLNESIIVCHRDPTTGYSKLTPLVDLPGYARALAEGTLGQAVTAGKLVGKPTDTPDYTEFERLLGIR